MLKGTVVMLGRQQEAFRLPTKEAEMDEMAQGYSAQFAQVTNVRPPARLLTRNCEMAC